MTSNDRVRRSPAHRAAAYAYHDRPWYAAIPWLTGLAGVTERIRLGTMVSSPNFRHPVTLTKEAMTLDHVSAGRFTLGIGAGGLGFDTAIFGEGEPSAEERASRLAEFVDVVDGLLRHSSYSHRGEHYVIDDADVWITYGDPTYRETSAAAVERIVRAQAETLDTACADARRDAAEIERLYLIGNTDERPLASAAAFAEFAARYAALGFTDVVFHHPRPTTRCGTSSRRSSNRSRPTCCRRCARPDGRVGPSPGRVA